jgi:hypothetical protein
VCLPPTCARGRGQCPTSKYRVLTSVLEGSPPKGLRYSQKNIETSEASETRRRNWERFSRSLADRYKLNGWKMAPSRGPRAEPRQKAGIVVGIFLAAFVLATEVASAPKVRAERHPDERALSRALSCSGASRVLWASLRHAYRLHACISNSTSSAILRLIAPLSDVVARALAVGPERRCRAS